MAYNSFRINFLVRVSLLSLTMLGFFYLLVDTELYTTIAVVGGGIVVQIISMMRYVDRTNRVLNNFLESIRYSDFSRTFQVEGLDSSFDKLKKSFNEVIKDFQEVRAEKEENYYYLQTVIQHIGIALIAYGKDGKVELINNATKKLFQLRSLNNINDLSGVSRDLVQKLKQVKHGENSLVRVQDRDELLQLSIYATEFKIHNRSIMLISIKNIQAELDEKEMESWQKLIRVLTHEIMNSITPISSLSSTIMLILKDLSENLQGKDIPEDDMETIREVEGALETIHKRTDGLMHFVNTYRNLTKIPTPTFTIFPVSQLFANIQGLMSEEMATKGIKCQIQIEPESLELSADEKLIEQVLINLVQNAIQALESTTSPQIILKAFMNKRGRITIQVIDNGQGILPNVLDKIFIPFFTTKASGSGIGLSLSKQILRLHGGTINAYSEIDKETNFTLTF